MDTFEAIHKRRSIRKFMDIPVPFDSVVQIIKAGMDAPSPGNLHNYKIILVQEDEKIKKIAEAALQQFWIETAKVAIVICDEPEKIERHYSKRGKELYSIQGCAAMAENMLLAANALGLASCWVGAFEEDMVKRALNIPDDIRVQAILPIGYPDEAVPRPKRPDMDKVIFIESYGRKFDMDTATGYWSGVMEEKIRKGKNAVEKKVEKEGKVLKKEMEGIVNKVKRKLRKGLLRLK
jgi:nitroreductase